MNVRGVLAGMLIGLLLARLPGAIIGAILGYWLEGAMLRRSWFAGARRDQAEMIRQKAIFVFNCFATMGYIARGGGRISEQQIAVASAVMMEMNLDREARQEAQQAFNDGKQQGFDPEPWLRRLVGSVGRQVGILQAFLELQLRILDPSVPLNEEILARLQRVAKILRQQHKLDELIRIWRYTYSFYRDDEPAANKHQNERWQRSSLQQKAPDPVARAYGLLGVSERCSDSELKRRYRKMLREHHPDKVAAKGDGVGATVLEQAKRRTQEIINAYQTIRDARQK